MDDAHLTADALAAAAGDGQALARFVGATQREVHRLCAFLVHGDDAADVAQDAYLRAITALGGYRGDAPARLWLLSIARRSCADHFRTRYRRRAIEEGIPPRSEAVPAPDPSLWSLLDELHPDQRAAFVLTQLLGFTYPEAARALVCPVGTVRSRVARARTALVALLVPADAADPSPPDPSPAPPRERRRPARARQAPVPVSGG